MADPTEPAGPDLAQGISLAELADGGKLVGKRYQQRGVGIATRPVGQHDETRTRVFGAVNEPADRRFAGRQVNQRFSCSVGHD